MSEVKFFRGLKEKYNSTTHADAIYFATDEHKILMNGDEYGGEDILTDSGLENLTGEKATIGKTADGELKVISSPETYITENIKIAGGPLAVQFKEIYGDSIPADKTLAEILTDLVLKEIYPTPTATAGVVTLTGGVPTITFTPSISNAEVGTNVLYTITPVVIGNTSNTAKSTIVEMSNGYATTVGGTINSAKTISTDPTKNTSKQTVDSKYKVTVSSSKVTNLPTFTDSTTLPSSKTGNFIVGDGINKIDVTQVSPTVDYTIPAITDVYYASNLGNTKADKKIGVAAVSTTTSALNKTVSKQISGYRNVFVYYGPAINTITTASDVRDLATKSINVNTITTDYALNFTQSGDDLHLVICVPAGKKVKNVIDIQANNSDLVKAPATSTYIVENVSGVTSNLNLINYNVFHYKSLSILNTEFKLTLENGNY